MVSNKYLFAHPAELTGPKLLKIAETRSNQQISNCVTDAAAAAKPAIPKPTLLTGAAVASRILGALKLRVRDTQKTLREVQVDFAAVRKANGIKVHVPGFSRTSKKGKSVAKTTSSVSVAARSSEVVMKSIEEQEDSPTPESELSESESDDEQQNAPLPSPPYHERSLKRWSTRLLFLC